MTVLKKFPAKIVVSATSPIKHLFKIKETSDGHKVLLGFEGKFTSSLCQALKCECEVIAPPDGEWGRRTANGNWTGMIGQVYRGEADIALNWISKTKEREDVVEFSESYHTDDAAFVTHLPKVLGMYGFTQPFDHITWAIIFSMLLLLAFLFSKVAKLKYSIINRIFDLSANLLRQFPQQEVYYRRYLFGFWLCFVTLIEFCYLAAMSLLLTVPVYEKPIRNLLEMSEAVAQGRYKMYLPIGSDVYKNILLESENESIIKMVKSIVENNWFVVRRNVEDDFFDGRSALFVSKLDLQLEYGKSPISTKYVMEDAFGNTKVAVAISKKFCCKSAIDKVIIRLKQAGIPQKLMNDEIFRSFLTSIGNVQFSVTVRPLSIQDIKKTLLLLILGYLVAFGIFLLEIIYVFLLKKLNSI